LEFPLPDLSEDQQAALAKAWSRQDLGRYIQRWENSQIPEVPEAFYGYEWRAVDVGCGMGKYILAASDAHPNSGFLGIDKGSMRAGKMLERSKIANRPNLFCLNTNAIPLLAAMPDQSLDQLSIFYPNPWWPNKHRAKRWQYHPILPKMFSLLKPGGQLILTSNERFYLAEFDYTVRNHPDIADTEQVYAGPVTLTEGRTHFETKFLTTGEPIGEIRYHRI
jgi:tRNA (guanine-N7-)-methyltransferase